MAKAPQLEIGPSKRRWEGLGSEEEAEPREQREEEAEPMERREQREQRVPESSG